MRCDDVQLQSSEDMERNFSNILIDKQIKTRTGAEPKGPSTVKPRLFPASGRDRDPVQAFHLYASKRPEQMNSEDSPFYLAVNLTKMANSSKPWFKAAPMGVNKLNSLMKTMAQKVGLNAETLTNHSGRKRMIQKLNDQEVPPTHIMQISGHKNVQSLNNYSSLSEKQQRNISPTSWAVPLQLGDPSQLKKEKMSVYQKTKSHLNKYCPYFKVQTFTEEHLISR